MKEASEGKKDSINKSLDRSLEILELLAFTPHSMSVQQLSEKLNVNRTTLYATLNTMCNHHFIEKDPSDGKFSIGYRLYEVGIRYKYKFPFIPAAEVQAKMLYSKFSHQINLCVYVAPNTVLSLISEISGNSMPFLTPPSSVLPAHASAVGKIMLAMRTDEELDRIFSNVTLTQYTKNTLVSKEKLFEELQETRINGYALDKEEYMDNINCIAAPIYDYDGNVIAGISISSMSAEYLEQNFEELSSSIISSARQISISIGWKP